MERNSIAQSQRAGGNAPQWLEPLSKIVGANHLFTSFADRLAYARDRAPYSTFQVRDGALPGRLPAAVVQPGSTAELVEVVRLANRERLRMVPFGAGSGVLCGVVPLSDELVVDLKRLNRIVQLNEEDGLVTVQAGKNGGRFEEELQAAGFTTGHLPQSLHMSTVGGWAACRGAGQASTLYGKIEDMVVGLRGVLPTGREIAVRPAPRRATGPSIIDLLVGSEGAFGVITEVTLRVWRLPAKRKGIVLAFPDIEHALRAMRRVMQAGLRPAMVRVYDEQESRQRTENMSAFADRPVLGMLEFCGVETVVCAEVIAAVEITAQERGTVTDDAPYYAWQTHRYVSYSPKWQADGYYMDTIEISAPWSRLLPMYDRMRECVESLTDGAHFAAHWSHVYPEGACQYMTVRLPPMPRAQALVLHRRAWDTLQKLCCEMGGAISHHHGIGAFRGPWMGMELGAGLEVLQIIKDGLDPLNLMNPGKLGLRAAEGGVDMRAEAGR